MTDALKDLPAAAPDAAHVQRVRTVCLAQLKAPRVGRRPPRDGWLLAAAALYLVTAIQQALSLLK